MAGMKGKSDASTTDAATTKERSKNGSSVKIKSKEPPIIGWEVDEEKPDLSSDLEEWMKFCEEKQGTSVDVNGKMRYTAPEVWSSYMCKPKARCSYLNTVAKFLPAGEETKKVINEQNRKDDYESAGNDSSLLSKNCDSQISVNSDGSSRIANGIGSKITSNGNQKQTTRANGHLSTSSNTQAQVISPTFKSRLNSAMSSHRSPDGSTLFPHPRHSSGASSANGGPISDTSQIRFSYTKSDSGHSSPTKFFTQYQQQSLFSGFDGAEGQWATDCFHDIPDSAHRLQMSGATSNMKVKPDLSKTPHSTDTTKLTRRNGDVQKNVQGREKNSTEIAAGTNSKDSSETSPLILDLGNGNEDEEHLPEPLPLNKRIPQRNSAPVSTRDPALVTAKGIPNNSPSEQDNQSDNTNTQTDPHPSPEPDDISLTRRKEKLANRDGGPDLSRYVIVRDGVDISRGEIRHLGPPGFKASTNKTPLQRSIDATQRRIQGQSSAGRGGNQQPSSQPGSAGGKTSPEVPKRVTWNHGSVEQSVSGSSSSVNTVIDIDDIPSGRISKQGNHPGGDGLSKDTQYQRMLAEWQRRTGNYSMVLSDPRGQLLRKKDTDDVVYETLTSIFKKNSRKKSVSSIGPRRLGERLHPQRRTGDTNLHVPSLLRVRTSPGDFKCLPIKNFELRTLDDDSGNIMTES